MILVDNINYVKPPIEAFYSYFHTQKPKGFEQEKSPIDDADALAAMSISIIVVKRLSERVMQFSPAEAQQILKELPVERKSFFDIESFRKEVLQLTKTNDKERIVSSAVIHKINDFGELFIPFYNSLVRIANRPEIDEESEDYKQFWIDQASNQHILGKRVYGREAFEKLFED